jgi:hypothetical protein
MCIDTDLVEILTSQLHYIDETFLDNLIGRKIKFDFQFEGIHVFLISEWRQQAKLIIYI